jgi:geranylgeranyl pyrophosphate synthase|tara:strand:+ start:699 stop:1034 length:336 start_codon:yes stop_codon:yes gene_type:complete
MVQKNIIYDVQTGKTTVVDYTAEEQAVYDDYNSTAKVNARKLEQIKEIRLEKLKATDYMANSDYTMPDYIKTWRQSLRDIPANNDSSKYDDLLKRDDNGNLTHTIWTQPTE